jgi:hypothetical protein
VECGHHDTPLPPPPPPPTWPRQAAWDSLANATGVVDGGRVGGEGGSARDRQRHGARSGTALVTRRHAAARVRARTRARWSLAAGIPHSLRATAVDHRARAQRRPEAHRSLTTAARWTMCEAADGLYVPRGHLKTQRRRRIVAIARTERILATLSNSGRGFYPRVGTMYCDARLCIDLKLQAARGFDIIGAYSG